MKHILVVILITLVLLLPACSGGRYYPPSGTPPPETPSPSPSTPSPKVSPPLNVRIDYIGVRNAMGHEDYGEDPFYGEVQLVIVITDGKNHPQIYYIPQETPQGLKGCKIGDFEVKEVNRKVYHTSSAGDYLKLSIIAYDIDSKTKLLTDAAILEVLGALAGVPEARIFKEVVSLLPQEDDLIGDYEATWYPDENWGIGQHTKVGYDNFRVWFSIWSDEKPPLIPEPSLLPDVKIQSVEMPSKVKQSNSGWFYYRWYTNTLTLVNHESCAIKVQWSAVTSAGKEFGGTVTIPAKEETDVSEAYYYENDVGPLDWTYTISHDGKELDSWPGTMNVIPGPYSH